MPASRTPPVQADLVVVGAGIVGLATALEAVERGLSVVVVERNDRATGASVRNFGHICLTAQTGQASGYAEAARERWLRLRDDAGVWVQECGTLVIARSPAELAVLTEFGERELLAAPQVRQHLGQGTSGGDDAIVGGAFLPRDLRVDPRQATASIADHLARCGVRFLWSTSVLAVGTGGVLTSRGRVNADFVVVAVGHDLDQLLPEVAEPWVQRCTLHMLRVASPLPASIAPAVLSGTSLLRYSGFLACPSSSAVREQFAHCQPELLAAGVNLMLTQHPSGDLIIGDTHSYAATPSPFAAEEYDELLLHEAARLLGVETLQVRERWLGTYAWAPDREFVLSSPASGVRTVTVTSGIGMTTGLGLGVAVLTDLLDPAPAS
ncbi:MAG: TIGR03364 family FAD-dependent oxidoreductase [Frankiales bacterium]|nr:TIGR03364 family FAD-dependent oxidoreductase [Frankiales bacterium]